MQRDAVTVEQFYTNEASRLGLKLIGGATGLKNIIGEPTVNRPGLALAGFTKYFASKRVQAIGHAEASYLKSLPVAERTARCEELFTHKMPCVIFNRNLKPDRAFLRTAELADVPIFQSPLVTMKFINLATLALEQMFAPRGTELGSMVDILGVGVIIKGESGIGKSECVVGLIERGYSLVADDVTRVSLLDDREVIGTCSELTRSHMEVRGIGIINVAAMFGVKAVRMEKRVDLVVTLKAWDKVEDIDRLGIDQELVDIFGVKVPHITLPVRPGRDLAGLVEVAALQTKLKAAGYNPARELNERLKAQMNKGKAL